MRTWQAEGRANAGPWGAALGMSEEQRRVVRDESEGDEAGKLAEGFGTRSDAIRSATGFYRFPLGLLQVRGNRGSS